MDVILRDPCCLLGLGTLAIGGLAWLGFAGLGLLRGRSQRALLLKERIEEETP